MLGVVLWSDAKDGKAVFWCEDQGDLAYYENADDLTKGIPVFDPGDMVQFDVSVAQRLRRASNAKLVQEQAYTGLPETLRKNGSAARNIPANAKVVHLQPSQRVENIASHQRKRKA